VDRRGARTILSAIWLSYLAQLSGSAIWLSYLAQPPVAANQTPTPAGPVTKMMGARQGWGRLTLASIFEFPAALTLKLSVLMLAIVAAPSAPMLWQLTTARKSGNGFV
jgi:hypothetical protein